MLGGRPIGTKVWIFQFWPKISRSTNFGSNRRRSMQFHGHLRWNDPYVFVLKTATGRPGTKSNIILMLHQMRFHTSFYVLQSCFSVTSHSFLCVSCSRGTTSLV